MDNMENKNNNNENEIKDNEISNNKNKLIEKREMVKILLGIAFLAILFCGTYFITGYFNNPNINNPNITNSNELVIEDGGEKVVLNQTPQALEDNMVVVLKTKENIDSEKTVAQLKAELSLTGEVTKESLSKVLESEGYELGEIKSDKLVFNRESEHVLVPNKFYLGEKDGMLAIYKTSENGEPKDIYVDKAPINILPEVNQESLKNFEKYYDTEEEAHMMLTAYTS